MKPHLRGLLLWATVTALSLALGDFVDPYKHFLWAVLPTTMFHLPADWWAAMGMTAIASLAAWIAACTFGYLVGLGAAMLHSSQGRNNFVRRLFGRTIDQAYRYIYIVPFVLVVSISFGVFYPLCMKTVSSEPVLPKWCLWLWMVLAAGVTLGGYRVFRAVFSAVLTAKYENEVLISGLHTPGSQLSAIGSLRARASKVFRLTDCDIGGLVEAVEQAFLLSVVAVMIVEAVIPGIHEYLFEQSGPLPDWARGAGGLIVWQQANLKLAQVCGVLWAVIMFDTIALHGISLAAYVGWLRHYYRPIQEAAS